VPTRSARSGREPAGPPATEARWRTAPVGWRFSTDRWDGERFLGWIFWKLQFFRVSRESRVSIGSLVPFLNLSTFQAQVSRARADPELRSGELGEVRGPRRCSLAGCPAEPHSLALRLGIFDAAEGAGVHGGVAGLRLCELGMNQEEGAKCCPIVS
jgi:hypothetical protein